MPWQAGTYSKGNNSTGGWTGDASLGIGIEAGRHDTQDNDFATGINQCLNKDGSNSCTGDLNLGGFRPVNLAAGTAAAPAICAGGDVNTGIFSAAADQIGIATNGTEKIRIDSSGNIGINTTSPAFALDIYGASTTGILRGFTNDAGGPGFVFNKSRSATVGTNTIVTSGDGLGTITWQGANGSSYTSAASIAGNVDGTPGASNDMPGRLVFSTTSDGAGTPTERMRIDSLGRIGIGVSPVSGAKFTIRGEGTTSGTYNLLTQDSGGNTAFLIFDDGLIRTGLLSLSPYNNTTALGANLVVGTNGNIARSTSSLKYKTGVVDYDKGLETVLQLQPKYFKTKNGDDQVFAGLIAEQVHDVGLSEFVQYADDNSPDAISYGHMAALFTKAIQELNAKVEALEARIAELEAA